MKRVDVRATFTDKRGVLLDAVRMKAVDPKYRIVDTIRDSIGATVFRNLRDTTVTQRAEHGIIKRCRPRNVGDPNSGVIDHRANSCDVALTAIKTRRGPEPVVRRFAFNSTHLRLGRRFGELRELKAEPSGYRRSGFDPGHNYTRPAETLD